MLKTVILMGGPQKGTRFRPLSLDVPKPLFPVAGFPMVQHLIEAASKVEGMKEIILIGSFQPNDVLSRFISNVQTEFNIMVRYLQEYTALGTAGGMFHFRDRILCGSPELFFVLNSDVCGDFPLQEMLDFHRGHGNGNTATVMGTEATRSQALNYGCIVEDRETHRVLHYVEKPETFVSSVINCGVYLFSPDVFKHLKTVYQQQQEDISFDVGSDDMEVMRLEQDILMTLANQGQLYVFHMDRFWSQIKSSSAAIYANRHYLRIYHRTHPERLAQNTRGGPTIIGDVFIHHTATVHPTATLGPNVTIGKNATVGAGVRVKESMVLENSMLKDHSCILHSIVGWDTVVGPWTRVEGTPNDPNPNKPFTKLDSQGLFNNDGRLNPSITVLGSHVQIPGEVIVLNSIVLPHKELTASTKNQIIL